MNTPGLFILGAIVSLIVLSAIFALIYAAVLDGRDQEAEASPEEDERLAERVAS
jgi:hypothetical protein